jgi:hypothetical protein
MEAGFSERQAFVMMLGSEEEEENGPHFDDVIVVKHVHFDVLRA